MARSGRGQPLVSPRKRTGIAAHHLEWMALLDVEGPFLSLSELAEAFPQGLDADDPALVAAVKAHFDAWLLEHTDQAQTDFVHYVLGDLLEYKGLLHEPLESLHAEVPGRRLILRPTLVVAEQADSAPAFLLEVVDRQQPLDRATKDDGFHASPVERARMLAVATKVPLALVTNGRQWALVHAPSDGTTSVAIWETELWFDERLTFRAFVSLLGVRRTIGAAEDETLVALFDRSAHDEREVTDRLGYQVRRSVELLVRSFDRADDEAGGALFKHVPAERIYEAAITVAMRIVFLLAAEARELLPDDEAWIDAYAVTPLRDLLVGDATSGGEELLERRFDAWPRLLATFRAVHGGVEHDRLRLAGYGGGLFDPKRFPFLEGVDGRPLRIPNRTIFNVLTSLQTLDVKVAGGRERRPLSYTALGVEQIGHTYERLLDHTAIRVDAPAVGLVGKRGEEPEVALTELEAKSQEGRATLIAHLHDLTGKTEKALEKLLATRPDEQRKARLHAACQGDADLVARVSRLLGVVRDDDFETPMIFRAGGVYVTESRERRTTGTYYTPPSLTEPIVRYALEPVVYRGPREGKPESEWSLAPPNDLLDLKVCDIAVGSGAFLVAACRYLGDRLVEAWDAHTGEKPDDLPVEPDERRLVAKRLVAERCLYGVDKNPLAVEIAKVSLWLETMRRDRPFTFVDHSLRCGDSLLGLTTLEQLEALSLRPKAASSVFLESAREEIRLTIEDVRQARKQIEATDAIDLRATESKAQVLSKAERDLHALKVVGDLVVGAALERAAGKGQEAISVQAAADEIRASLATPDVEQRDALLSPVIARASDALLAGLAPRAADPPEPFHWVLEFPEVFESKDAGFDAIVGNPPFLGAVRITEFLGEPYNDMLSLLFPPRSRRVDLSARFLRRAVMLMRPQGCAGLLATNTISQGQTRRGGLDVLLETSDIFRAIKSFSWPGEASVIAAAIWFTKGEWTGVRVCDGSEWAYIGALLEGGAGPSQQPARLKFNRARCFQGPTVWGDGFFLTAAEARRLLADDERNADVVKPFIGGREINASDASMDLTPERWIVAMGERTLKEATSYVDPFALLNERVRPWRTDLDEKKYRRVVTNWWKFFHARKDLFDGIEKLGLERVLARSRVSDHHMVTFLSPNYIYSDALVVFLFDSLRDFAVIQSTIHEVWARKYASTLKTDMRYVPGDCFYTFPLPDETDDLGESGDRYFVYRHKTLVAEKCGLTKLYNRMHDRADGDSDDIEGLRRLHRRLDRAVADAYGWSDLELDYDFRDTPVGLRYTISESVRIEVLDRLLELNHARYAEEVAAGLHEGSAFGDKSKRNNAHESEPLFVDG